MPEDGRGCPGDVFRSEHVDARFVLVNVQPHHTLLRSMGMAVSRRGVKRGEQGDCREEGECGSAHVPES